MIKIQSISDIITNSSSEVFIIYDKWGINKIKDIINSILKISNSNYTCDDLFEIELEWNDDYLKDLYKDKKPLISYEEFREKIQCEAVDEREIPPVVEGIKVTPKLNIDGCKEAADLISEIGRIFKSDRFYC